MKKPVLVIMAAGMGSRYGGLKQIDPIDSDGHIIIDFSIYDAVRAGFEKVIFIIKRENEQIFRETIGKRAEGLMEVAYVFQELENIPDGFTDSRKFLTSLMLTLIPASCTSSVRLFCTLGSTA